MSVARVTEITAGSPDSFEHAIQEAIGRASKTLHNIQGAWVNEQSVVVEKERIKEYRVNLRITFILDD